MTREFPSFPEFFRAATGHEPYLWQTEAAHRLRDDLPLEAIDVPTGLGKTGVLHAWCWALAAQASDVGHERRTVPLRLHMVVDRRVVVDDTLATAQRLTALLGEAQSGPLAVVAGALRALDPWSEGGPGGAPLAVTVLRGGLVERPSHVRSVTMPTIAVGTVDMVMSRLLWRGYGLATGRRPLDAALVGVDSMIVLDEAHLAPQTLRTLDVLTEPNHQEVLNRGPLPRLRRVVMSATLSGDDAAVLSLDRDAESAANPDLASRLARRDRTQITALAQSLDADVVLERLPERPGQGLVVFCNTAAGARALAATLRRRGVDALLLTGGMPRPVAAKAVESLAPFHAGADPEVRAQAAPTVLVTTQTLEVGADLDFDDAVTEAAPLDSLVQRIGRVNRVGARDAGSVTVTDPGRAKGGRVGPYSESVVRAVHAALADVADVGELGGLVRAAQLAPEAGLVEPQGPVTTIDAATLFDLTVTDGFPGEEPVGAWIRPVSDDSRVDVVVREGIEALTPDQAPGYVRVDPAAGWEAWSVPASRVPDLVAARAAAIVVDADGGVELVRSAPTTRVVRAGWTVYLSPVPAAGATPAARRAADEIVGVEDLSGYRARAENGVLPLLAGARPSTAEGNVAYLADAMVERLADALPDEREEVEADVATELATQGLADWAAELVAGLSTGSSRIERDEAFWYVTWVAEVDDTAGQRESLDDHSGRVVSAAVASARALALSDHDVRAVEASALRHDWGKVERAFQLQLDLRPDPRTGTIRPTKPDGQSAESGYLAKSELPRRWWRAAARAAGVSPGWRHEALSVALSDAAGYDRELDVALVRHLIGTHHGHLRGTVELLPAGARTSGSIEGGTVKGVNTSITAPNALQEVFDPTWWTQFVDLSARYGPYQLALLEAVVRFADWHASGEERTADGAVAELPIGDDQTPVDDEERAA